MKQLWAPWRCTYINVKPGHKKRCFLCQALKSVTDRKNLLVRRGKKCFVMMNLFPYNAGHLLICPKAHKANLEDLTKEEIKELFDLAIEMKRALTKVLKPEGFNMGFNIGAVAGAGLLTHIHLHLVPRWGGDTNFMPVLSGTKVISQSLSQLYERLQKSSK
ncbi:MAG: HIT domain-containing protein [Planctomycetes bacterium]|nr:HIT domain-containing protein [Planctomycetota bacterium]MBI5779132.1 HIT domain-containing protein [Planctomycetota bacterium]